MIYQNFVPCRAFSLCYGSMSANEFMSSDYSIVGARNLSIYVHQGSVQIKSIDQGLFDCQKGSLVDLQAITNGLVEYGSGDSGLTWMCINNNQREKEFNFELINQPTTRTVVGSEKETYLVCIEKTITCNEKPIVSNSYARIRQGSQAAIVIPEHAVAVLMIEK
jgi:hypothetical protein